MSFLKSVYLELQLFLLQVENKNILTLTLNRVL